MVETIIIKYFGFIGASKDDPLGWSLYAASCLPVGYLDSITAWLHPINCSTESHRDNHGIPLSGGLSALSNHDSFDEYCPKYLGTCIWRCIFTRDGTKVNESWWVELTEHLCAGVVPLSHYPSHFIPLPDWVSYLPQQTVTHASLDHLRARKNCRIALSLLQFFLSAF